MKLGTNLAISSQCFCFLDAHRGVGVEGKKSPYVFEWKSIAMIVTYCRKPKTIHVLLSLVNLARCYIIAIDNLNIKLKYIIYKRSGFSASQVLRSKAWTIVSDFHLTFWGRVSHWDQKFVNWAGWLGSPREPPAFASSIPWLQVQLSPWSASVPGLSPRACLPGKYFILLRELSPPVCLFLFIFPLKFISMVSFICLLLLLILFCVHLLYFLNFSLFLSTCLDITSFFLGYFMI